MELLEGDLGLMAGIVERRIPTGGGHGVAKDLFGFADIIAVSDRLTIAVQSTSLNCRHAHLVKLASGEIREAVCRWVQSEHRQLWLISWGKKLRPDKRGTRRELWTPHCDRLVFDDLTESLRYIPFGDFLWRPELLCASLSSHSLLQGMLSNESNDWNGAELTSTTSANA